MDLFRITTVFIILCTTVITTTAAPILEEDIAQCNGQYGEYVEGDMLLTKKQQDAIYDTAINTRNGLVDPTKRWPNRTVVYNIEEHQFARDDLKTIKKAMADIEKKSCLKFRPRQNTNEHAVIIKSAGRGCFSSVGYSSPGDLQVLNLGRRCVKRGIVVHHMLHTLGFYHMHSTYNRDDYVTIVWENIESGHEHNFKKYGHDVVTDFGAPYDYNSIMHYGAKAFSANGKDTIIPIENDVTLGPKEGLSDSDIFKLKRMYCEDA